MKRQELAAGSKPARCFRRRDPVGGGCSETLEETVSITADKSFQSSHGPLTASSHAQSSPMLRHTFPSLKELPRDFGCQVSFPPPQGELFFLDLGLTSSWPVMSILKMEDDYITASPCSRRKSCLRPVRSTARLCRGLSSQCPLLSSSATGDIRSAQKSL